MRKKLSLLLTSVFLLCLVVFSSCTNSDSPAEVNARFTSFTDALFCQEVASNTITLHYTLQDPRPYGIKDIPVSYGTYSTDVAEVSASVENCLAALTMFDYTKLSSENQLTYDVLESYLTVSSEGAKYTLYDEPLSPLTGIQAQLPVLLSEFPLSSSKDVDTYLALLAETPGYFDSLISFEHAKSEQGLFMASYIADAIIKECNSFILMGNRNYLYSSFNSRINRMEDLSEEDKASYIKENERLVKECVFPAYVTLKEALSKLRSTGNNPNGLCHLPDGASYYEYVVKRETGSDRTIIDLQKKTLKQMREDLSAMQEILTASAANAVTLENTEPSAILEQLEEDISAAFPAPPKVNTEVKYVQKEMEEYLSPAFYMVPAIDNTSENVIYINEGHLPDDLDLYTTLAHEGYPGHLYQTVYYASQDPAPIRSILSFGGYTEGWATYSEMLSYYYAPIPKDQATLMQRNTSVLLGIYALADMGIHYEGWTLLDTVSFFREYGITDTATIEHIYDLIIADPANYLKYYIGYIEFLDLKKEAIKTQGEDFSQKNFHKAILDIGPAPFDILRTHILQEKQ